MARRGFLRLAFAALCLSAVLPGCSRPEDMEVFVPRQEARDGVYVFALPLQDTTAAYDFWFYSRSDSRPVENLRLNVQWLAPSGDAFAETVFMRSVGPKGTKERYRSGMIPAQAGDWQLSVRPVGAEAEELLGFGFVCKKRDGTR
jgi:hypothetical protein